MYDLYGGIILTLVSPLIIKLASRFDVEKKVIVCGMTLLTAVCITGVQLLTGEIQVSSIAGVTGIVFKAQWLMYEFWLKSKDK